MRQRPAPALEQKHTAKHTKQYEGPKRNTVLKEAPPVFFTYSCKKVKSSQYKRLGCKCKYHKPAKQNRPDLNYRTDPQ